MRQCRILRVLVGIVSVVACADAAWAQAGRALEGMWSDPPDTIVGRLCNTHCSDAAIDLLYALIDDPANDKVPYNRLRAQASDRHNQYIRSQLIPAAAKAFPLDPADDPALLKCEPYGLARQIFSRHQLQIRTVGPNRLELRYGEWDARRTIDMSAASPRTGAPSRLGSSVGRWDGDVLVIETAGVTPALAFGTQFTSQLRVTERYTRASDGQSLTLVATIVDPGTLRGPMTLKRIWRWAPESTIDPYVDCEIPSSVKRGTQQ